MQEMNLNIDKVKHKDIPRNVFITNSKIVI